jgi:cell division protein ZapA
VEAKNRTVVRIAGKEYGIKSSESEEYVQKLALYLDKKMSKIMEGSSKLSTSMAAVLAALHITGDLFKLKEEAVALEEDLKVRKEKTVSLENEKNRLQSEKDRLEEEVNRLRLELVKCETELKELRNRKNYKK